MTGDKEPEVEGVFKQRGAGGADNFQEVHTSAFNLSFISADLAIDGASALCQCVVSLRCVSELCQRA